MEVYVECAECGTHLEEHKVELKYGNDVLVAVPPCHECMDEAARKEGRGGE